MGIQYYADYTIEELQKDRKRYEDAHPAPFKLEDFLQNPAEICKIANGELEEKSYENACTISNVDGILIEPSAITILQWVNKEKYEKKQIKYTGNYTLLIDFLNEEGSKEGLMGTVSARSINDKFITETKKGELKLPLDEKGFVVYFPTDQSGIVKMRLTDPKSGMYRCSAPNLYGRSEKVDCMELSMLIRPPKKKTDDRRKRRQK